jgi:hypothetical protein
MNIPSILVLSSSLAVLAGCASSASVGRREPYVKPGLILLTADQAERRGIELSAPSMPSALPAGSLQPLDAKAVITPADVKVYTLNRAVDPADANLMHEEHVVYRRETSPQWRLNAAVEQKILVGPRVTDGRQQLTPLLDKELTTYLSDQRRATEANQQAIAALLKAVDALSRQQRAAVEHELQKSSLPAGSSVQPAIGPEISGRNEAEGGD